MSREVSEEGRAVVPPPPPASVEVGGPAGVLASPYVSDFLNFMQYERRLSPATIASYRGDLSLLSDYLRQSAEPGSAAVAPSTAATRDIRGWMVSMLDEGYTPRAINRKVAAVRSFHKFLVGCGVRLGNACEPIVAVKGPRRLPVFVEEADMEKVLDPALYDDDYVGVRDRTIMQLFYLTGMRVSELAGLTDDRVDMSVGQITVIGKGNKQRIVPITSTMASILRHYYSARAKLADDGTGLLLRTVKGRPINRGDLYKIVHDRLLGASGFAQKSPHVLRHTFATAMLNNGADLLTIKELLGHTSLTATQVYTHAGFSELEKIYKQAHPRGGG